jgi:rhodanese-related sulfurtransferase
MRTPLLLGLAALVVGCGPAPGSNPSIEASELVSRLADDRPFILDVRTRQEYDAGHIPGSVLIPHDELAERLDELPDPSQEIVVHCKSGRRAGMAESILAEAGYTNVRDLTGHWNAWEEAGHPVE